MGDPLDFLDEGGWPYPDDAADGPWPEPVDLRSEPDDDLVAWHALSARVRASLTPPEWAAVQARFGLDGGTPLTMAQLAATLGLSPRRTRTVLTGGLAKLRSALGDGQG